MTTEEKAKAYDEALEDMRVIYPNLRGDAKLAVEHAFPELVESEDERIRQAIIHYILYETKGAISEATEYTWVKWLEKQKEPHYTKRNALFDKCVENCDPGVMKRVSDEVDEMLEKEQKPKFNVGDTIRLKNSYAEYTIENISDGKYYCKGCSIDIDGCDRDYELVQRKSAELSEEDDMLMDELESYILYDKEFNDKQKLWRIKRLKSLRPQPKAELTLLDENIIDAAVAFVEQNNHFSFWGGIDKHTVIKALHSLKFQWKPTDEQMDALKDVAYGTYQNGDGPALRELYEQLKKRM